MEVALLYTEHRHIRGRWSRVSPKPPPPSATMLLLRGLSRGAEPNLAAAAPTSAFRPLKALNRPKPPAR